MKHSIVAMSLITVLTLSGCSGESRGHISLSDIWNKVAGHTPAAAVVDHVKASKKQEPYEIKIEADGSIKAQYDDEGNLLVAAKGPTMPNQPNDGSEVVEVMSKMYDIQYAPAGINYDAFYYPIQSGVSEGYGYPIYLIECNDQTDTCVGPTGEAIGNEAEVAEHLNPIRNFDVIHNNYACHLICRNAKGDIIGKASSEVITYLAKVKQIEDHYNAEK